MKKRFGEYAHRGDYHLHPEHDWPYLPVYLEKLAMARRFLNTLQPRQIVYDMGCGEGILVNEYRQAGYQITGMDLNYSSKYIIQRDFLKSGIRSRSADAILCLDVIEHLWFDDQEKAIAEFARILKPGGQALITVPNLAHLASRVSFLLTGKLIRTSSIERHPGDRPVAEFVRLFEKHFVIHRRKGMFPTFPLISILTVYRPSAVIGLHRVYNRLLGYPNWCFLNVFFLEKRGGSR